MKTLFRKALLILVGNKVKQTIPEDSKMGLMLDVDGKNVRIFKRQGRNVITCDCENGTKFNDALCKHKIAGLLYCWENKLWN